MLSLSKSWVWFPEKARTDQMSTLDAMQVIVDKHMYQMHKCDVNAYYIITVPETVGYRASNPKVKVQFPGKKKTHNVYLE